MPNIIEITDFHAPELDIYARYTEGQLLNRHEPEKGIFIAESPLVIGRALDGGCQPISILVEDRQAEHQAKEIIRRCDQICKNIPVFTAPFEVLTELTGFKLTRGLLCAMHRPPHPSVEQVCRNARRVAAALHMDAVLLTFDCSNPLYRRAVRVSMGTVFQVPWTFLKPGIDLTEQLHELGFRTAAMALRDDSCRIDDPVLEELEKLAVVLGTEGEGLAADTISNCDYTVRIPMSHGVDSLNVAAASAVAFWQLGNQ